MTDVSWFSTSYNIILKEGKKGWSSQSKKLQMYMKNYDLCEYADFWAYPKQGKGVNVADETVNVVPHHDAISLHRIKFTLNT